MLVTALAAFPAVLAQSSMAYSQDSNQGQSAQQPSQQPSLNQSKPSGEAGQPAQQGQQGQAAAPAAPAITPDERNAYSAIQHEIDPARQSQMVDDFAKKYPNSPLLSDVYFFGAYAYQTQGNVDKAVDYGEKSVAANGTNLRSLLLLSELLPQPQEMQGSDTDKEKKLQEAETDANKALAQVPDLKLPPTTSPDQATAIKQTVTSQAHAALGMVHLQRATMSLTGTDKDELAKAETEYKAAVAVPKPGPEDYFRLGEVYEMENKFDEAIDAFTQCSKLSQGQLQTMANTEIEKAKKAKAQAPAPAAKP
jgi:tetratricopeptide (TPR) repeat protein